MWRLIGSSLLTRGKPRPAGTRSPGSRLIPAYAGKTKWHIRPHDFDKAHPCLRGENDRQDARHDGRVGSSLLTRGKRSPAHATGTSRGLIPAYAGKTRVVGEDGDEIGAHPCLRGENGQYDPNKGIEDGSSLLTRGKPGAVGGFLGGGRLIPAYAGKTRPEFVDYIAREAHPCLRGENPVSALI